jgi:(R,R)-butanediol dehydrogenase/meso-butanediol dehydrogenase/diacetyl reductase
MPGAMKAAVYTGDRTVAVEERPVPVPSAGEVVIAVEYCGICGTDLHSVMEGWGRPGAILGHEYSGRIAAVGPGVGGWAVGDEVTAEPGRVCGTCEFCAGGRPSLCREYMALLLAGAWPGAFAEFVPVSASQLHRIPPGLGPRAAALTEPLAVALHAITRSRFARGQAALVTGAGPLGCLHVAALKAMGAGRVIVSEPSPARRAAAYAAGADRVVAPQEFDPPESPLLEADDAVDVAFECSGNPAAFTAALAQLRPGGTLVIVGTGMVRPELDHHRVIVKELIVTGALNYDATGFDDALRLLGSGALPVDALIAPGAVPLASIMPAMEDLAAGHTAAKVLVAPGG